MNGSVAFLLSVAGEAHFTVRVAADVGSDFRIRCKFKASERSFPESLNLENIFNASIF